MVNIYFNNLLPQKYVSKLKINYIILAHQFPLQLKRLVNRLNTKNTRFYIHIDKNKNIKPFFEALAFCDNVTFLDEEYREEGIWGDIGIVKATIKAMAMIVSQNTRGFCVLLTGQDYPLKSADYISNFLADHSNTNFIDLVSVQKFWKDEGLNRIHKYKINKSTERGHFLLLSSVYDRSFYKWPTLGKLNFLRKSNRLKEAAVIFKKRKFPKVLEPVGGSVYWTLPITTVGKILSFIENNPTYIEYHRYTLCADEIFFHSIVADLAKNTTIKIEPSLTYANWSKTSGPRPLTFKAKNFNELQGASKKYLFARKFDINVDKEILDKCDKELLK